jgi:hypothetical protein
MAKQRRWMILVTGLAIMAGGCAHAGRAARERNFCPTPTAVLYVQNDNWLDVVIYAVRGGTRYRLGEVVSFQSGKFNLPSTVVSISSDIYVVAHPIGGAYEYYSPEVMLGPGQNILELRVDNLIDHSSLTVSSGNPEEAQSPG